jgi:rhamnogalacturonyl hydrolase YesR
MGLFGNGYEPDRTRRRRSARVFLPLAVALLLAATAQGQATGRMDQWNGIPTSARVSATEQAGIDEDILIHRYGDIPVNAGPKAKVSPALSREAVDAAVRRVADWELKRAEPYMDPSWTWAVLGTGLMAASRELNDPRYRDAMARMAEKYHWEMAAEDREGRGWPDNNDQAIAQTYLELYRIDPKPERLEPTQKGLDSLIGVPQPPPPSDQFQQLWWWCDSLFMGPPLWAHMSAITRDPKYLEYADRRWWETTGTMYSTSYHLFYRDKIYIGVMDPAMKPVFWSRGNGWVMGGLARTLEYVPKDDPNRPRYEAQLRAMAHALAAIQDRKNGLWHADLLDPVDYPQPEISGSSLITFGLAWGVNNGILDRATYLPVIRKAWRGMLNEIYEDGRLGNIQQTDEAPEHYLPQSSYNFGVGGFLLAGEEVAKLAGHSGSGH